jgi:hypothetical protein
MTTDGLPSNYGFADLTLDVARRSVTRDGQSNSGSTTMMPSLVVTAHAEYSVMPTK